MFKRIALSTAALIASSAAWGETIPSITIYSLRTPLPLSQVASSVTVITAEDIARENKSTVVELLRRAPGLSVANNGGPGQTTRVFMRGANSDHVLVLLDGVAINDPSDPSTAFDFSNLTTDNIERIEILRGPQSTLYGSQAIGGVINIISKQGGGAPRRTAFVEAGRYATGKIGAGISGETGGTRYSLQASQRHTDGISSVAAKYGTREKDGNDASTVSLNLAHKVAERITAKFNARYNRSDTEFDSPGSFVRPLDDAEPVNDSRQLNARAAGEWESADGSWGQEFGWSRLHVNRSQITEYYDNSFNTYFGRQQYKGWREALDWIHRLRVSPQHQATLGLEKSTDYFKSYGGTPEVNADNFALFLDNQLEPLPGMSLALGGRVDDHQTFGRRLTWKLAPAYRLAATGGRLKASYGTGFKAPSLFNLYDTTYGNNRNLQPEHSRGYDIGFEQPLFGNRVQAGASWFHNRIDNLITTQLVSAGPPAVYQAVNIGKAHTQGVESSLSWLPDDAWTLAATHTFVQADNMLADTRLLRRPKHLANISATYAYAPGRDVGFNLRHVGLSKDIDFQSPYGKVNTKAFTVFDINANYRLDEAVTLYGRAENILDRRYEEIYGYGQPGASLFIGAKTEF